MYHKHNEIEYLLSSTMKRLIKCIAKLISAQSKNDPYTVNFKEKRTSNETVATDI